MDTEKVLIVMTSGPDTPRRCGSPFYFASLAAAMDYEVDMFFTMDGVLLLVKGVAEMVYPKAGQVPASRFMQDAREAGVRFLCCSGSADLHDIQPENLLEGVKLVGGATMWELAESAKTVLSF